MSSEDQSFEDMREVALELLGEFETPKGRRGVVRELHFGSLLEYQGQAPQGASGNTLTTKLLPALEKIQQSLKQLLRLNSSTPPISI